MGLMLDAIMQQIEEDCALIIGRDKKRSLTDLFLIHAYHVLWFRLRTFNEVKRSWMRRGMHLSEFVN